MNFHHLRRIVAGLLGLGFGFAYGMAPGAAQTVDHLVAYIRQSGCTFTRNGTAHDAAQAADHIQSKYQMVADRIETVEDFIKVTATRSSMSGLAYTIQCGNAPPQLSADWLHAELRRYRAEKKQTRP